MRFITAAVSLCLSAALAASDQTQNFSATCIYSWYQEGSQKSLSSCCDDGHGGIMNSWVDLDDCLENSGGKLQFMPKGNFSRACRDCYLEGYNTKNPRFTCECDDGKDKWAKSTVALVRFLARDSRSRLLTILPTRMAVSVIWKGVCAAMNITGSSLAHATRSRHSALPSPK